MKFVCKRCGKCCINMSAIAMVSDLERWKEEGREDILVYVDALHRIWTDPDTKKRIETDCPFLTKDSLGVYICSIQETKPYICKEFKPASRILALDMGCEGYEE